MHRQALSDDGLETVRLHDAHFHRPVAGPARALIAEAIGVDYAPTGLWDTLLGQPVPPTGDAEFAKKLLSEGANCPTTVTLDYAQSADADKAAAVWVSSEAKAGITVKLNPIEIGRAHV